MLFTLALLTSVVSATSDFSNVPGVVINHIPASEERYVGSPSIAVLPDGTYVTSHDEFGPKSQYHSSAITHVFRSTDKGKSWTESARIEGAFWSTLFVHRKALYLIGTTKEYGDVVIRRSNDGGKTWTTPRDENTGLLRRGEYHCAPMPVITHNGRLWRAMEDGNVPEKWGVKFRASMMSAPLRVDLLKAANWTTSNIVTRDPAWLHGTFNAWLEGNAVVTPDGNLVDILRVDRKGFDTAIKGEVAAIVRISKDGKRATFDPQHDFVSFPGGSKKFAIRYDKKSHLYWSLSNTIPPQHADTPPAATRNTLALISSPDLRQWTVRTIVLYHPDQAKHGFQYVDWLFDGADMIVACRTAFDDGQGGAHNMHDANFLTFHRIQDFRKLTMKDSVAGAPQ